MIFWAVMFISVWPNLTKSGIWPPQSDSSRKSAPVCTIISPAATRIDFAVLAQEPNPAKYHSLAFPNADLWGLVMPKDCPLAEKDAIYADDLTGLPLFCSEQGWNNDISKWCGSRMDQLHLEGSFRLSYNGSLFVKEGLGYLLTFEHLINTNPGSGLVFRPLAPKLETKIYLIWKKYQVFTPIAERLLRLLESEFSSI